MKYQKKLIIFLSFFVTVMAGMLLQSCEKKESSLEKDPFITTGERKITKFKSADDPELLCIQKRLKKTANSFKLEGIAEEITNENINWKLAYKTSQGSMRGIFIPLKSSTEDNFKLLASLYVHGKMKEYIIQKKINEKTDLFTGEINCYEISGNQIKQKVFINGKQISEPVFNKIRLKSGDCETDDGVGTFDDYDDWFDSDCDSDRFANNTDETIWYKPENGSTAKSLEPGEWTDEGIDGYSYNGTVVKICDGYNTCGVSSDGSYDTDYSNPINYGVQLLTGGTKDEEWLADRQEEGDHGWDDLFSK